MTHVAGRSRRGIPKAWILPLLALTLLLAATAVGIFSRSIALDFLAWWPVWLLLLVIATLTRGRRWGRIRVSGVLAIVSVLLIGSFVVGHVQGWPVMPSASVQLVGPTPNAASKVALSAHPRGILEVRATDGGFLYSVLPVRRGGDTGPAMAREQVQGTNLSVDLSEVAEPGLYLFAGWELALHTGPTWDLSLGGRIDADLASLRLTGLQLDGEGSVDLGTAAGTVVVNVSGDFVLSVPANAPVRVVGDAVVPGDWLETENGHASPAQGEGWVVSVASGATLTVIGR